MSAVVHSADEVPVTAAWRWVGRDAKRRARLVLADARLVVSAGADGKHAHQSPQDVRRGRVHREVPGQNRRALTDRDAHTVVRLRRQPKRRSDTDPRFTAIAFSAQVSVRAQGPVRYVLIQGTIGIDPGAELGQIANPRTRPARRGRRLHAVVLTDAVEAGALILARGRQAAAGSSIGSAILHPVLEHGRRAYIRIKELATGQPDGWRHWKSLLGFYKTGENKHYSPESIDKVRSYLESMNGVCHENGCRFVIYFVPGAIAVSKPADIAYFPRGEDLSNKKLYDLDRPFLTLKTMANQLNIPLVDLTPYLRRSKKQPVYFPESWHWNNEGHQVVAGVIAQDLIERGL